MKEAIVSSATEVEIVDSPVPKPGPNQVVTKVIVSGSNPKDWKIPEWGMGKQNSGDDVAGTVHAVGENVYEFKPGDRVAAFHEMRTAGGSFAEYAVSEQHTTFHIPHKTSFEEAATLPLAAMTAAIGLHIRMGLPEPWRPATQRTPLVVYGAASAVGAFAIQLARLANLHPIIGVAGKGIPFAEGLIDASEGDAIVDYREGDEAVRAAMRDALQKAGCDKASYAFDAISEKGSHENVVAVLDPHGFVTNVLPPERFATEGFRFPDTVSQSMTMVGSAHGDDADFAFVYFRYLARALEKGVFKPHPYEVVPGGLAGVSTGLQNLKAGKASAVKYVFRIQDTEGAGKD